MISAKLFCLILGFFIGVTLMGAIWLITYELHKDREHAPGRRSNIYDDSEGLRIAKMGKACQDGLEEELRNADPDVVKRAQEFADGTTDLLCKWQERYAHEMMSKELDRIMEKMKQEEE